MHEEQFELLHVVDEELVEAAGQEVAGALVGSCSQDKTQTSRKNNGGRHLTQSGNNEHCISGYGGRPQNACIEHSTFAMSKAGAHHTKMANQTAIYLAMAKGERALRVELV